MAELKEYTHTETVLARPLSDQGESIVTTTHGPVTANGGYYVMFKDGRCEYWDAERFEGHYEPEFTRSKATKR